MLPVSSLTPSGAFYGRIRHDKTTTSLITNPLNGAGINFFWTTLEKIWLDRPGTTCGSRKGLSGGNHLG